VALFSLEGSTNVRGLKFSFLADYARSPWQAKAAPAIPTSAILRDIPVEGAVEPQFFDQLGRIGLRGKVVANAMCPPSGFGEASATSFRHSLAGISWRARVPAVTNPVSGSRSTIARSRSDLPLPMALSARGVPRRQYQGLSDRSILVASRSIRSADTGSSLHGRAAPSVAQDQRRRSICASVSAARGPSASSGNG